MGEPNRVHGQQRRLTDVHIVYLPPATVAASHYLGLSPERNASLPLDHFVQEIGRAEKDVAIALCTW